jgi:predicted helicase
VPAIRDFSYSGDRKGEHRNLPEWPHANEALSLPADLDDTVVGAVETASDLELFRAFLKAGERLAETHVNYEQQPEYPLTNREKTGEKLDWRVTKMRLSKDKTSLIHNQFLTLSNIPPEAYEYRLGNRSALEWVIDQYQVSTDKRSGIINDPNRLDHPQYIVRLSGQVITVSLETVKIVRSLPALGLPELAPASAPRRLLP